METEIEGVAPNSIEAWMLGHNIHLSRDAINKLKQNGFIVIDDLRYCSVEEMYKDAKQEMNIKLADCKKIKCAMQTLSTAKDEKSTTLMGHTHTHSNSNEKYFDIENQNITLMGHSDNEQGIDFIQADIDISHDYKYKYQKNKYLQYQHNIILQYWHAHQLCIPQSIQQIILQFSQYATLWNTNLSHMTIQSNNLMKTFRGKQCFPLNKGIYSFTVTFENVDDNITSKGHILKGLNFVGICSERYTEFNKYILFSCKQHIYGFGDDNESRAWMTWIYSGKGGDDEPKPWNEILKEKGTFGHKDTVSIVVNMIHGYIKGYRNKYSFVERKGGHILLDFDPKLKYYPVVSMYNAHTQCKISFGP